MAAFRPATAAAAGTIERVSVTESSPLSPVRPTRPVVPYVGGKRNLSRRLVEMIGAVDHQIYAEPFVGMGGVFFRRDRRPGQEVINDLSGDVATFFRVVQEHYPALMDELKFKLSSRAEFERLMRQDPATLTDLRRAARFLYLQALAFGGKVKGRSLGVSYGRPAGFDVAKLGPRLQDIHDRLSGVLIEQLPFDRFIARYDRPETLFYVDPPYWGTEDFYGAELFGRGDFERLAGSLKGVRGQFIVSLNDVPEVREIFAWAEIESVGVSYGLSAAGSTAAREVIIRGGGV